MPLVASDVDVMGGEIPVILTAFGKLLLTVEDGWSSRRHLISMRGESRLILTVVGRQSLRHRLFWLEFLKRGENGADIINGWTTDDRGGMSGGLMLSNRIVRGHDGSKEMER